MLPPSGDQVELSAGGYHAVVTESGAALRTLSYYGRDLVDGFDEDAWAPGCRGQWLLPWPNRVRDGAYRFLGKEHQLGLSEPETHTAAHGLVRWASWTVGAHSAHRVSLRYRLMAQPGYPWTLDLEVTYRLSQQGLTAALRAHNRSADPAPFAAGAHPYLAVGPGPVDDLELTLPASTRLLTDERLLPTRRNAVEHTPYDFREARRIGGTGFDHGFGDLMRDDDGRATTVLRDPASGEGVALWVDRHYHWLQVYSADGVPERSRRSLAVEPMTAPADSLRSTDDLVVLGPDGSSGDAFTATWGIRALP